MIDALLNTDLPLTNRRAGKVRDLYDMSLPGGSDGLLIVAIRHPGGNLEFNPGGDMVFESGACVVVMGRTGDIDRFREEYQI